MSALLPEGFDFVSTGWIRFLPEPALDAYLAIWSLHCHPEGPVVGDLDELGAKAFGVERIGGFDAIYDAAEHADAGVVPEAGETTFGMRWTEFCAQAARRGMPMDTPRDAIEFMRAIGLLQRIDDGNEVRWEPAVPVPLAEDLLVLSEDTRRREAEIRWRHTFMQASNLVTGWLVEQRTASPTTEASTTLRRLAKSLDLDVESTRHGLVLAMTETGDITTAPHPERAEADDSITIVVDWERFDADRITLRLVSPDEA